MFSRRALIRKTIDNPGGGDCGYYAFGIALLPTIRKELLTIPTEEFSKASFFQHLQQETTPILCKMLQKIKDGICQLDGLQIKATPNAQASIEAQMKIFQQWLNKINNLKTIDDLSNSCNSATRELLLPMVYFFRGLLATRRMFFAETILLSIPKKMEYLEKQQLESQALLQTLKKLLADLMQQQNGDLNSEMQQRLITFLGQQQKAAASDKERLRLNELIKTLAEQQGKKLSEQLQQKLVEELSGKIEVETLVANRGLAETRVKAFESSYNIDNTHIHQDIMTVLLMHLEISLPSDADIATIRNVELEKFTDSFITWWIEKDESVSAGNYDLIMTFIACLYGKIPFEKNLNIKEQVEEWWKNPTLHPNSIVRDIAKLINVMGTWATEIDLTALAQFFEVNLKIENWNTGIPEDPNKPTLIVENQYNVHWVTYVSAKDIQQFSAPRKNPHEKTKVEEKAKPPKPATAPITPTQSNPQEDPAIVLKATELIKELDKELSAIEEHAKEKSDLTNLRITVAISSLKKALHPPQQTEPVSLDTLKKNILDFKKELEAKEVTLKECIDDTDYATLRKVYGILRKLCRFLGIKTAKIKFEDTLEELKKNISAPITI